MFASFLKRLCVANQLVDGGLCPEILPASGVLNAQYEGGVFLLEPGDRIVLLTDGISESMNKDDEEWWEESLIAIAKSTSSPADEMFTRIMLAAQAFAKDTPQCDDMTVVALQVSSPSIT